MTVMQNYTPRIAIYLHSLYNGGTDRVMLNLAQQFTALGLKVDLVLDRLGYTPYLEQIPSAVRVINLNSTNYLSRLFNLVRYLRQEQPTALMSASYYPNIVAILAKRLAGVSTRIVVTEHNSPSFDAKHQPVLSPRYWFFRVAKFAYPHADGIVAVSRGTAESLAQLLGLPLQRIQTIYNPIVTPELFEKAKEAIEHPWFMSSEMPVIIAVGRLEAQKDFSTLIAAFAKVRKVRPARLLILGEGSQREMLAAMIRDLGLDDCVALPGFVQNPYAYTARSAVLVLSSVWEGLSNVLIEALAVGTPVVATNCKSGPSEVLDNGNYGELVPVGNSEAIAAAILKTLSGQKKQATAEWIRQFTAENSAQKYLEALGVTGQPAVSEQSSEPIANPKICPVSI